jgi:hypothetical protein
MIDVLGLRCGSTTKPGRVKLNHHDLHNGSGQYIATVHRIYSSNETIEITDYMCGCTEITSIVETKSGQHCDYQEHELFFEEGRNCPCGCVDFIGSNFDVVIKR